MSMDSAACSANTIDDSVVEKVCKFEYDAFMIELDEADVSFDEFANGVQGGDTKNFPDTVVQKWVELTAAFKMATGLELDLVYSNEENGGRYDDFTGARFSVGGVYVKSKAAVKFEKTYGKIEDAQWTVFG